MAYYKHLIGEKIYLSPVDKEHDIPAYTKWINDLDVSVRLGNASILFSEEAEKAFLEKGLNDSAGRHYAIIKAKDDTLLGNVSLFNVNHIHRNASIGLFIGEKAERGCGYGREAMCLALAYGFGVLNLHNIMLGAYSFNENAIGLYESIGFKEIGRRRASYFFNGIYYDEIYMDLLSTEFQARHHSVFTPVTIAIDDERGQYAQK